MTSSAEAPQPLARVVRAVQGWVDRLGEIWVEAQVIEIKRTSRATHYLTLRDKYADISASVTISTFALDAAGPLPEGSQVTARLKARVWERSARLNFECLELRVAGEGRLLARLEALKQKLRAEGLFEPHRKKRLPFIPRRIGLIAGQGSDAERDVVENVMRRWPTKFEIEHALVQGPNSAESVMRALARLDEHPDVGVIVIARGGGSLEDLLSFSDEGVIRAVAAARTPVVSAIGHEQDTPLLDFVADVRASTPTDAAKHVVPDLQGEARIVAEARQRLDGAFEARLAREERWLHDMRSRPVLREPTSTFAAHLDRLEHLRHRLASGIDARLREQESELRMHLGSIRAMSPKATLERGYAVLVADRGSVSSVQDAEVGSTIRAHLADGQLDLEVTGIHEQERNG